MTYSKLLLDSIIQDQNSSSNSLNNINFYYSYFSNFNELDGDFAQLIKQNSKMLIVSDENCCEILANDLLVKLKKMDFKVEIHVMSPENSDFSHDRLAPTLKNALELSKMAQEFDLICGVGSGVINDLCKKASFEANLNYVMFPTAASMNGYVSAGASLIDQNDLKTSHQCHLPQAIFFHLPTLLEAPMHLTLAGVGDLLSYRTCYADWLLSNIIFKTPYVAKIYEWMTNLKSELKGLVKVVSGRNYQDRQFAMMQLCDLLLINGFSMTYAGGSYPCSQGEHMMAHLIESQDQKFAKLSHGTQIIQTSNFMYFLQTQICSLSELQLSVEHYDFPCFLKDLGEEQSSYYERIYDLKKIKMQKICESGFDFLKFKRQFASQYMKQEEQLICKMVAQEFAMDELGEGLLKIENIDKMIKATHATRNRMGFLDIAVASGQIDIFLEQFFDRYNKC